MPLTIKQFFRNAKAAIVHQDGSQATAASKGVKVILHTREKERHPCSAEVISGEHHAEIGLSFRGRELSDYDGAFFLPREVGDLLEEAGYVVPDDCFARDSKLPASRNA
jgi:hypothetical protein